MTNAAAIGYMIQAAKWLKLKPETIKKLDRAMYEAMDELTEEEAEAIYREH
jgi:ABC-type nitrate/sulfonate/bicarbonate transport system substrate-binding protein